MRAGPVLELGQLLVEETGETRPMRGETAARVDGMKGTGRIFTVSGPDGLNLEVTDVTWQNKGRDVRVLARRGSPEIYDILRERLRLGVLGHKDKLYVELSQARLKEPRWANVFKASVGDLKRGAGIDVKEKLLEVGATLVTTREVALNDGSPRGGYLCAVFDESATLVPVAAFALTRIAPIAHGIKA